MPLQDHHQIVSVDDHVIEHPRVFTDRLPAKFQEVAPKIVETEQGHHVWLYEGNYMPNIGLNAVAGKAAKDFGMEPVRYEDMIPGCYDPVERIKDMDIDGVWAALSFPSFAGFGGGTFIRAKDKELAAECVKAWNDFMIDEWCAAAPERLIPLALLPVWDIEASVKSFDLLKHHLTYSRVVVLRDQQQIFRRARLGGKIDIVWTPGIRKLTAARAEAPAGLRRASGGSEG